MDHLLGILCNSFSNHNSVKQAATMDRHITPSFQIPVASIQSSAEVAFFISIPIYDRIFVPVSRCITKRPTGISMLQRIGTGIFMSLLAMMMAALVEQRRLAVAIKYVDIHIPNATVPMSLWWLAPQNIAFGVVDVFILVGLQQFFYDQAPKEFRSIGYSLYLSVIGIGHFLSSFPISMVDNF